MPENAQPSVALEIADADVDLILDELDHACTDVNDEQRAAARHPLRGRAVCVALIGSGGADTLQIRLRNLSITGIGFLCGMPLRPGTRLQLLMPHAIAAELGDQLAVVRRYRVVREGIYEIGADFIG